MNSFHPKSLTTSNGSQYYVQAGDGPVLLLIHGSLCDYRYWRWQVPALADSLQVVAPSLRGYWPAALNAEDPSFGIDQHVADMLALLDHLSPDRAVHVLGHSRGAQIAAEIAIQAPGRVASLVLADPGFRLDDEPETPALHADPLHAIRAGQLETGLASFVNAVNGQDIWKNMVGWFKTMVKDNAYTLLSQAREMNLAVNVHALTRLDRPALLVHGANSPARYLSRIERLQSIMPNVQRCSIGMASHGMNLANPKAFNQAVLSFVNQHSLAAP